MEKIDREKDNQTGKQMIIIRGAMQVVHQLPSQASSPRRQKRQIHEVTTLGSIPLGAASARLRSAHCLASLGISSPPYPAYHL